MAFAVLKGIKVRVQMRGLSAFYREGKRVTWSEAVVEVEVCVDVECLPLPTHP